MNKQIVSLSWMTAMAWIALGGAGSFSRAGEPGPAAAPRAIRAEMFRTDAGWIVFRIAFTGAPDAARTRVLVDVDGPEHGAPGSGAEFMIEGPRLYRYPEGSTDWAWDEIAPPLAIPSARALTYAVRELPGVQRGRWRVETIGPDLAIQSRFPEIGTLAFDLDRLAPPPMAPLSPEFTVPPPNPKPPLSVTLHPTLQTMAWQPVTNQDSLIPAWQPPGEEPPRPLKLILRDAVSGGQAALQATSAALCGSSTRWTGQALGMDWEFVTEPDGDEGLRLYGLLRALSNRCIRLGVGIEQDLQGWRWHDDVSGEQPMDSSGQSCRHVAPSPFGFDETQSVYPLGVIASARTALVAETDPSEPRVFQIAADPAQDFFGIWYDMALTPDTLLFPGQASFRCSLRALDLKPDENPFRRALTDFYARHPDVEKRRAPDGVPQLIRLDPWTYSLPLPPALEPDELNALRLLQLLACFGNPREAALTQALLASAARRPDQTIAMFLFADNEDAHARMEANLTPGFPVASNLPVSRAMVEWGRAKQTLEAASAQGLAFPSVDALTLADYNLAAIHAALQPCVWQKSTLMPAVALSHSACAFVAGISEALAGQGRFLSMDSPCASSPFFMPYVDIAREKVQWIEQGQYRRLDDRAMNARRALSGKKIYEFLLDPPATITGPQVRRYLEDCLAWGFLSGFADATLGAHPDWVERDQALFQTYEPLARRLALIGWNPTGPLRVNSPGIAVEHFGDAAAIRHVTVRNRSGEYTAADLVLQGSPDTVLLVNPLNAGCQWLAVGLRSGCPFSLTLAPNGTETLDLVPLQRVDEELSFLRAWQSGSGEAEACIKNIESARAEFGLGALCRIEWPRPMVGAQSNRLQVIVRNAGSNPLTLEGFKLITPAAFEPYELAPVTVAPDSMQVVEVFIGPDLLSTSAWLEAQWLLRSAQTELSCSRFFRPDVVPPIQISATSTHIAGEGNEAWIELVVRNNSAIARTVDFRWQGDFKNGRQTEAFAPETWRTVRLPVRSSRGGSGQMLISVFDDSEKIYERWFNVRLTR